MSPDAMATLMDRRASQARPDLVKLLRIAPGIQAGLSLYSGFKFASRKACQDRALLKTLKLENGSGEFIIAGVFDGHGIDGHKVAAFVADHIWKVVLEQLNKDSEDIVTVLDKSFHLVNKQLSSYANRNRGSIEIALSGTTGTCCVVNLRNPVEIYVANVGDSQGILCSETMILPLTYLHNFEDPFECERIIARGGIVDQISANGTKAGPKRCFRSYTSPSPGLAVSRSFGDTDAHDIGCTCAPDITVLSREPGEDLIILASDGVWDVLGGAYVNNFLRSGPMDESRLQHLILEAAKRWIFSHAGVTDDISLVFISFSGLASLPSSEDVKELDKGIGIIPPEDLKLDEKSAVDSPVPGDRETSVRFGPLHLPSISLPNISSFSVTLDSIVRPGRTDSATLSRTVTDTLPSSNPVDQTLPTDSSKEKRDENVA
jgi:serine/threonine protein phosphatase PrpC